MEEPMHRLGSVKRLEVTDFMSFVGTVSLEPGPYVNLITGPNGSGKSSLVTALCVGLAGNMKSLGRQTRPEELIRRGCSAFEVITTLSGGPGKPDIVVRRRTSIADAGGGGGGGEAGTGGGGRGGRGAKRQRGGRGAGVADVDEVEEDEADGEADADRGGKGRGRAHSVWELNGRRVTEAQVKERMRGMGIHFENLCQFLPQERVSEFAHMSSTDLLLSTEEAIGAGELLRQHKELMTLGQELGRMREELSRVRQQLAKVQSEQQSATAEYQRLQRRNELRKEVEQLKQKQAWLEVRRFGQAVEAARQGAARCQGDLQAAQQSLAQAEQPLSAKRSQVDAAKKAVMDVTRHVAARQRQAAAALGAVAEAEEGIREQESQLTGLQELSKKWTDDCARARGDLARAQQALAALPAGNEQQDADALGAIGKQLEAVEQKRAETAAQLEERRRDLLAADRRVVELNAVAQRRADRREMLLNKLEQAYPGTRELDAWLQQQRQEGGFHQAVMGPLLLDMSPVANPEWAAVLEKVVSGAANLAAVVVQNREDNNKIQSWLESKRPEAYRGKKPYANKILWITNFDGQPTRHPHGDASQYAQYGISHTLDEVFEAPLLVKRALCDYGGINTTYLGDSRTDRMIEQLFRQHPVRRVYAEKRLNTTMTSRYDPTATSTSIEVVTAAWLLDDQMAAAQQGQEEQAAAERAQLQQARTALASEIESLASEVHRLEEQAAQLRQQRKGILDRKHALQTKHADLRRRVDAAGRKLQGLEAQGDPMARRAGLVAQLSRAVAAHLAKATEALGHLRKQHDLHRRLAAAELAAAAASAAVAPLLAEAERARNAVRAVEAAVVAARQQVEVAQAQERAAKEALAAALGGAAQPSRALREAWARLPEGAEELEEMLAEKEAAAQEAQEALRGDEAEVVAAWQRRETEIGQLQQQVAGQDQRVAAAEASVVDKKAAWLPVLQQHVSAVSATVSEHFRAIGCVGEVALVEAGEDFAKYCVEIRVKYRPEEALTALDRNRHSGGERSVATMIYIMALQGATATPFRVVDEINQGMDSRNERKVFNLLVASSSRPDTPQCFLLTPKLISNLTYTDTVRVLSIEHINQGSVWMPYNYLGWLYDTAVGCGGRAAMYSDSDGQEGEEGEEGSEAEEGGAQAAGGRRGRGSKKGKQATGRGGGVAGGLEWRNKALGNLPWSCTKDFLLFGTSAVQV